MFKRMFRRIVFWAAVMGIVLFAISQYPDKLKNAGEAYQAGNCEEAVRLWQELAERGDTTAQHNLGSLYKNGRCVDADALKAYEWFRKAADAGSAASQYEIGKLIDEGLIPAVEPPISGNPAVPGAPLITPGTVPGGAIPPARSAGLYTQLNKATLSPSPI